MRVDAEARCESAGVVRKARPAVLKPLPQESYELSTWKRCRVNIDYHVEVENNLYSVPYQLIHEKVEARVTASVVEVLFKGESASRRLPQERKGALLHEPRSICHVRIGSTWSGRRRGCSTGRSSQVAPREGWLRGF